jgi:hypothetical protein
MKSIGIWTAAVLGTLAVAATAQVAPNAHRVRMYPGGVGAEPRVDVSGSPLCFGDGSGAKCGGLIAGGRGHGCENHALTGGALLQAHGMPSLSDDTFELDGSSLPFSTTVLYLQGSKIVGNGYGYTFGDGVMCLSGSVRQIGVKRTASGFTTYPETGDMAIHTIGRVSMLEPIQYYQVMYRDWQAIAEADNFNLSNAWMVNWIP